VGYVFAAVGPTVLGTTTAFSVLGVSAGMTQARHHPQV
jgi:hypothetical protein